MSRIEAKTSAPLRVTTLQDIVAQWLHVCYSRSPKFTWARLSEASRRRWRRDASALLELLGEDGMNRIDTYLSRYREVD